MRLDTLAEDRKTFSLGLWEKLLFISVAALTGSIGYIGHNFSGQMDSLRQEARRTNDVTQVLAIQTAVTNAQMTTLTSQLADVPSMARLLAELKVEVAEHNRRIGDLEQLRNLKR